MRLVLAFLLVLGASPASAGEVAMAMHGNWCGPRHFGGPVVDVLDAACRRHDLCVAKAGYLDCGCDLDFMDELRHIRWPSEALYQKGRAIYEAISVAPCNDAEGMAKKLEWGANDRLGALLSGREPLFSSVDRFFKLLSEGQVTTD